MNIHDATEQAYLNGYAKGREDAAREIFGVLECIFSGIRKIEYANPTLGYMFSTIDYLEKKYTEGK